MKAHWRMLLSLLPKTIERKFYQNFFERALQNNGQQFSI